MTTLLNQKRALHNTLADQIFDDIGNEGDNVDTGDVEPEAGGGAGGGTQDVDDKSQGKESQQPDALEESETPDEKADGKSTEVDKETDKEGKQPTGINQLREYGARWEKKAGEFKTRLDEVEPLLKTIEEKIGGPKNLELAAEIYGILANPKEFDPEAALEYLSETMPGIAEPLVTHIVKSVIDRATSGAIERTFGRKLSTGDIKAVQDFLASGGSSGDKFDAYFKDNGEKLPDALMKDAEGNELPPHVTDYMIRQNRILAETQAQIQKLESRVTGADEQQRQRVAEDAIEDYVFESFEKPIQEKISELGLDKPVKGETDEIKSKREELSDLVNGIAMYWAGQDKQFQAMYKKAIDSVVSHATNPKDRTSEATSVDYSRRIQARMRTFVGKAAEVISPLIDSFSTERGKQVENVNKAKAEPDSPAETGKESIGKKEYSDPFDDVDDVVADMFKSGKLRR